MGAEAQRGGVAVLDRGPEIQPVERRLDARSAELAAAVARPSDPVALIVMMGSFGAFFLLVLVRLYLPGGVTELDERRLYLFTGLFSTPFALGVGWVFSKVQRGIFRNSIVFPVAMALSNVLFWAIALFVYKRSVTMGGTEVQLLHKTNNVILLFLGTNVLVLVACIPGRWVRRSPLQRQVLQRFADDAYFLVPPAAAFAIGNFSNYDLTRWPTLILVASCGLPALFRQASRLTAVARNNFFLDAAVVVFICAVVYDANYTFDELHYSFFLGPTASLLGGRRPLVDINCQYGVGVIYFLATIFKLRWVPLGYQGMTTILNILGIAHFVTLYALLRLCLRSRTRCLLALLVMLAVRVFSASSHYLLYPSLGPLRFIFGDVLLLCVAVRRKVPRLTTPLHVLEAAIVGITSIWSAEAFAAALTTFIALVFYGALFHETQSRTNRIAAILKPVGRAAIAMGIAHALLATEIRLHAGQWPHWSYYFAYLILYSRVDAFWALPITTWEPWAPIVLIYFASLTALLGRRFLLGRKTTSLDYEVVWGMTVLGIVEFSHYIGRSHVDHLRVYLADIFVAAYWLDRVARPMPDVPTSFRRSFLASGYAAVGLVLFSAVPGFSKNFRESALGYVITDRPVVAPWNIDLDAPWHDQGYLTHLREEAVRLINKYPPSGKTVALFIEQYVRPVVLLQVGKAHTWPLSLTVQDDCEPTAKARILAYHDDLKEGDIVFVSDGLPTLDQQLVDGLKKRFRFSEIDSSPSGIKVVRLDPLGST